MTEIVDSASRALNVSEEATRRAPEPPPGIERATISPSTAVLDPARNALNEIHRYPSWDAVELRNAMVHVPRSARVGVVSNGSISVIQQTLIAAGQARWPTAGRASTLSRRWSRGWG